MPRTPKLTDVIGDQGETRADRIVFLLRQGAYLRTAAQAAGIGTTTLHRWLNDDRPAFRAFRDSVDRARADAQVSLVLTIQMHAKGGQKRPKQVVVPKPEGAHEVVTIQEVVDGDWRAAAWLLERSWPREYGRREAIEVSGPDGGAIQVRDPEAQRLADAWDRFKVEDAERRSLEPPPPPELGADGLPIVDAEVVDDADGG